MAMVLVAALSGCATSSSTLLDCRFHPVEFPEDELPGCAQVNPDGGIVLLPKTLAALRSRASDDPVATWLGSQLYYLNSAGRVVPTLLVDNGADYFEEGLARTTREGKIGFVDRNLTEVIPPTWDFAFPFAGGVAAVCNGCRRQTVHEEHSEMRGGTWGYINRAGVLVVPVSYQRSDLPQPPQR